MPKFIVETSARHVHVTQETLEILFGKGATLTKKKDLSQPGQFACEERVTVVGPKKELANVSILGPVRKADQIELSATDARSIGVAAPIRESEGRNNFFSNEVMKAIGERYGKSVAQVALRFLIQRDIIVIPKSTRKERMIENFDVFDFTLSAKDMEEIAGLDKRESLFFSHYDPEMVNFLINL